MFTDQATLAAQVQAFADQSQSCAPAKKKLKLTTDAETTSRMYQLPDFVHQEFGFKDNTVTVYHGPLTNDYWHRDKHYRASFKKARVRFSTNYEPPLAVKSFMVVAESADDIFLTARIVPKIVSDPRVPRTYYTEWTDYERRRYEWTWWLDVKISRKGLLEMLPLYQPLSELVLMYLE